MLNDNHDNNDNNGNNDNNNLDAIIKSENDQVSTRQRRGVTYVIYEPCYDRPVTSGEKAGRHILAIPPSLLYLGKIR